MSAPTASSLDSFSLILFGATGDLAKLKIFPAVYDLHERGQLPADFALIGSGRTNYSREEFQKYVGDQLRERVRHIEENTLAALLRKIYYYAGDAVEPSFAPRFAMFLDDLQTQGVPSGNRIFHLAVLPHLYELIVQNLGAAGLQHSPKGWVRLMIEKPFGTDQVSAHALNQTLLQHFEPDQVYRLDHYLGKETVQNILAFRFGNGLFEPIWDNSFIDHIQITKFEEFGVKDRGSFYDVTGALKDVVQNHLLQVLAVMTMEPPVDFSPESIREQRRKILESFKVYDEDLIRERTVRGQYEGYQQEKNVSSASATETFAALKLEIELDRWQGVPIYIRAGKKLAQAVSEVSIVFKRPPYRIFSEFEGEENAAPNVLTLRLDQGEAILLQFLVKQPGHQMRLQPAAMQFCYKDMNAKLMEPYAKLLLDVFKGDPSLFALPEEVEAQWRFIDPILAAWKNGVCEMAPYESGSMGPRASDTLLQLDGREWFVSDPTACSI